MPILHHYRLNSTTNNSNSTIQSKAWYETLWGLILISFGVNLLSNYVYDRGRERLRQYDKARERRRDIDHLMEYHNESESEAEIEENKEDSRLAKEGYPNI